MDGGAWWAAVHGVAQSRTRLSDSAAAAACILYSFSFNIYGTAMWLLRKKALPRFALIFEVRLNKKCFKRHGFPPSHSKISNVLLYTDCCLLPTSAHYSYDLPDETHFFLIQRARNASGKAVEALKSLIWRNNV